MQALVRGMDEGLGALSALAFCLYSDTANLSELFNKVGQLSPILGVEAFL